MQIVSSSATIYERTLEHEQFILQMKRMYSIVLVYINIVANCFAIYRNYSTHTSDNENKAI